MSLRIAAPFAALTLSCLAAGSAAAASPAYCALYAREYTKDFVKSEAALAGTGTEQKIQDKAFYKCLNMDEDPPLPDRSAYAEIGTEPATGSEGEPASGEGDAAADEAIDPAPAKPVAKAKPPVKVATAATGKWRGSGLEPFTPEWRVWCKAHYPNSFDPKTGTVKPLDGKRTLCR